MLAYLRNLLAIAACLLAPAAFAAGIAMITDASGRIVWVPGHAADAEAMALGPAGDVIVLTFEPPDVPGSEG